MHEPHDRHDALVTMHLLIAHNAYGRRSGEEQALDNLEVLLVGHGHQVSRLHRSSATIGSSCWNKVVAATAGIHNPAASRDMTATLRTLQPDLVLVQNLYPFLSPSILRACRTLGVPVAMRCCNYRLFCPSGMHLRNGRVCERCLGPGREAWCVIHNCEGSWPKSIGYAARHAAARLGRRILDYVDVFIVLTEFQREFFIRQGIPPHRLLVVPNHAEPALAPAPIGAHVTFLGRVSPEKGIADFLEMARRLPHLPFAVAGEIRESAAPLIAAAPSNVRVHGHLAREPLQALLHDSRIVVACSRWYEGFPNAILDAMSAGKPVLAAAVGALQEIVDHDRTGILYPPGAVTAATAQLDALYSDPARCARLGQAALQKVAAHYHPQAAYEAYMRAFRLAIDRPHAHLGEFDPDCESFALPLR
jgi:glycosyltransferase involved in cell wall biosynthesis